MFRPTAGNVHPFCKARPLFAFYIHDISVASASTTNAHVLGSIPVFPVVVLLKALGLVFYCLFEVGFSWQLKSWSVRWAVLDGGVSVTEVAEVVNILRTEEGTGCERVDGCVTPLLLLC